MSLSPNPTAGQTWPGALCLLSPAVWHRALGFTTRTGPVWTQVTTALGQDTAYPRENMVGNQPGMRHGCALAKQIHFQCSEQTLYVRCYRNLPAKRSLDIKIAISC